MTTALRKISFSAPVSPLRVELSPLKQKTLCERIWKIFCCCCCKKYVEEELGFHIDGDGRSRHWVLSPTPASQPRHVFPEIQDISAQNEKDYSQVTNLLLTDMTQLKETQRAAAMSLVKSMRKEGLFLDLDKFLEIEGFPKELLAHMHSVVSLAKIYERGPSLVDYKDGDIPASPSATFVSTSEGSSPTALSSPSRGFPESSSEDSLSPQFDQTSKDLDALKPETFD